MLTLTVAVEQATGALREVIRLLKASYYHYEIVQWDTDRWLEACDQLQNAIAIYDAVMNDWVIAANERPLPTEIKAN